MKYLNLIFCFCFTLPAFSQWNLPSPDQVSHPGSTVAPLSSPFTYPDEEGFQTRTQIVLRGVAPGSLGKWRRGYFTGGDPGKYLPGQAMAKLLLDPEDSEAHKYQNDLRSAEEHYHFAAVNWARFLPIFGEHVLTPETRQRLSRAAFTYDRYKNHAGTDNHRTMWWTSANVLPHYLQGDGGLARQNKSDSLETAKRDLHAYVKGLYYAGQGEWDSNIYLMFTMNGLMNIYDFSPDPEARLLAKAGLDLLAASYAQKYTNGIFAGPHQRGFPQNPYKSIADQSGFLWWGSSSDITPQDARNWFYSMHAITSSWRPNEIITHIAKRQGLPLPLEQRNSKANYWHGQGIPPKPGASHESVYITDSLTMGSLWNQHASQHSRFSIVTDDGSVFTGGHPRTSDHTGKRTGLGFRDGSGRYLQSAQAGPLYLCLARWPDDEEAAYTFFSYPDDLEPEVIEGWQVFKTANAVVAVKPVSATGIVEKASETLSKGRNQKMLRFPSKDQQSGFLVWVENSDIVEKLGTVVVEYNSSEATVRVDSPNLHEIDFTFNPAENSRHGFYAADVRIDGEIVDLSAWKIFGGPLLQQTPGVLTVSDGQNSFTVDFSGELPVYSQE